MTSRRLTGLVAAASLLAIAVEGALLFSEHTITFSIAGRQPHEIAEFDRGVPVRHAFLMRGDNLDTVRVRITSDRRAVVRLDWRLWLGTPDEPETFLPFTQQVTDTALRIGPQWVTLQFPRHGTSDDRWFTVEVRAFEPDAGQRGATLTIAATGDNPFRGGVLWVGDVRKAGSLRLVAQGRGRPAYRRFMADSAQSLPAFARRPAAQVAALLLLHSALAVFAYVTLREAFTVRHEFTAKDGPA